MKVVILAGGYGTRLSEETELKPKPMVEIGGKPILWHIMKLYSYYGFNEFIILLGYKGYYIKEYFANYFLHQSDVTFDMTTGKMSVHNNSSEPWKVTLLDTGIDTLIAGRVKKVEQFIKEDEDFFLTYGDGVSDVNIKKLLEFHKANDKLLTLTAIQPESRYGVIETNEKKEVISFSEKPENEIGWINGGFFVCKAQIFKYLENCENIMLEKEPMEELVKDNQIVSYKHNSFWKCMDTLRDKKQLESLYEKNKAKWMVWK